MLVLAVPLAVEDAPSLSVPLGNRAEPSAHTSAKHATGRSGSRSVLRDMSSAPLRTRR